MWNIPTFDVLGAIFTRDIENRIRGKSRIQQEQGAFCPQSLT
jgi:hypothetical protein